ncbi:ectoine hydroxylase [Actinophytocola gossypii]|uniref:Ectoine hydroxylase n=1 Tax=Actinophytocola gossypii TaxID=2812003 RepID=A0ABT2J447_9PSEU|nr:ectoine hydroxylase [Actinophytocola gossypii]MCT2582617.1 ectoine hydroxylase [Actinophytocola gossypii]
MTLTDTGTADPYPTRMSGDPELLDRYEPTVWTTGMAGPIDPATLAAHDSRGYSIHHDLLSAPEVAAFRDELDRLPSTMEGDRRVIVEDGQVRTIFQVHRVSPLVAELVRDPRVLDRARQILGSEVYVHQSRATYLPAFEGRGNYWHSDFETWHAEDGMPAPRAVSMSVALTDHHPFNGGLMMMPGSHRTFVPCSGGTPPEHYRTPLRDHEIGLPSTAHLTSLASAYGIEQYTAHAGAAVMFDANLMHGSGNNITPFPKANIFLVFNSVENTLRAPTRPVFVADRDFTPLHR